MSPYYLSSHLFSASPGGSVAKQSACSVGDPGLILGLRRPPGEGNGNPLQYSCLGNPVDRGAWWATARGVAGSDTTSRLNDGLPFARVPCCLLSPLQCHRKTGNHMAVWRRGLSWTNCPFESKWRFMIILLPIKYLQVFRQSVLVSLVLIGNIPLAWSP